MSLVHKARHQPRNAAGHTDASHLDTQYRETEKLWQSFRDDHSHVDTELLGGLATSDRRLRRCGLMGTTLKDLETFQRCSEMPSTAHLKSSTLSKPWTTYLLVVVCRGAIFIVPSPSLPVGRFLNGWLASDCAFSVLNSLAVRFRSHWPHSCPINIQNCSAPSFWTGDPTRTLVPSHQNSVLSHCPLNNEVKVNDVVDLCLISN